MSPYKAIIFDLGGVVLDSPLACIAQFEREWDLTQGFIASLVGSYADDADSPWHALERGEIAIERFCVEFDRAASRAGQPFASAQLMRRIARHIRVRPRMVTALRRLGASGFKRAALSNIWASGDGLDQSLDRLRPEFDVFVESYRVGLRKPEPPIYRHTCRALGVEPPEAVFLDDIGTNLKPARALGMHTIKVTDPGTALAELGDTLGVDLTSGAVQ